MYHFYFAPFDVLKYFLLTKIRFNMKTSQVSSLKVNPLPCRYPFHFLLGLSQRRCLA